VLQEFSEIAWSPSGRLARRKKDAVFGAREASFSKNRKKELKKDASTRDAFD